MRIARVTHATIRSYTDRTQLTQPTQNYRNKNAALAAVADVLHDLSVNEGGDNPATHAHSSDNRSYAASAATRLRPRRLAA